MNIETPNIFELASQRLKWLSDRQKVVSENIANADTAGYRAKEVESFDAYLEVATGQAEAPDASVFESEATWNQDLTGNNVVLEEQILEANATSGQYKIAANLYRKAHDMIRAVSG
ncbi:MAG: flagellar basal body rod protein [Cognatishimia sp.]|uniref:flagellar basal body protein n=1 Tax=Cognatishimia sp. TaxID=2211648 RepID=UPI003B8D7BF8